MGKFVLKVASIAFATIIGVVVIAFLSLAVFAPGKMASFYNDINFRHRAKIYAEVDYEAEPTLEKLVFLSDLSIKCSDNEYIVKYTGLLVNHSQFKDYISTLGENKGGEYYDFVASEYVLSLYETEEYSDFAIATKAFDYAKDYRKANSAEALMFKTIDDVENGDANQKTRALEMLKSYVLPNLKTLESKYLSTLSSDSQLRLQKDVTNLQTYLDRLSA